MQTTLIAIFIVQFTETRISSEGLVMNQQQLENKITRLYKKLINPQTNRDELNAIGARMARLIAMRSDVVVARMEREKGIDWRSAS